MAIKPLGDRVLIESQDEAEEKVGSLYIPDTAKEKPQVGVIVAVGDGNIGDKKLDMIVKVGDKVLYGKYAGQEVKDDGKEYLIVKQSDIVGILS